MEKDIKSKNNPILQFQLIKLIYDHVIKLFKYTWFKIFTIIILISFIIGIFLNWDIIVYTYQEWFVSPEYAHYNYKMKKNPDDSNNYFGLAKYFFKKNKLKISEKYIIKALNLSDLCAYHFLLNYIYYRTGRYKSALNDINDIEKICIDMDVIFILKMMILINDKKFHGALKILNMKEYYYNLHGSPPFNIKRADLLNYSELNYQIYKGLAYNNLNKKKFKLFKKYYLKMDSYSRWGYTEYNEYLKIIKLSMKMKCYEFIIDTIDDYINRYSDPINLYNYKIKAFYYSKKYNELLDFITSIINSENYNNYTYIFYDIINPTLDKIYSNNIIKKKKYYNNWIKLIYKDKYQFIYFLKVQIGVIYFNSSENYKKKGIAIFKKYSNKIPLANYYLGLYYYSKNNLTESKNCLIKYYNKNKIYDKIYTNAIKLLKGY